MDDAKKERLLLRLSPEARTALKVMAAQQNTTASALVESWIRKVANMDLPA